MRYLNLRRLIVRDIYRLWMRRAYDIFAILRKDKSTGRCTIFPSSPATKSLDERRQRAGNAPVINPIDIRDIHSHTKSFSCTYNHASAIKESTVYSAFGSRGTV